MRWTLLTLASLSALPGVALGQIEAEPSPSPAVDSVALAAGQPRSSPAAVGMAETVDRILTGDGGAAAWDELAARLEPPINPSGMLPAAQRVAIAIADSAVAAGLVEAGLPVDPAPTFDPVWLARVDSLPVLPIAAGTLAFLLLILVARRVGGRSRLSARERTRVRARLSRQLQRGRSDPQTSHDGQRLAAWVRSRAA